MTRSKNIGSCCTCDDCICSICAFGIFIVCFLFLILCRSVKVGLMISFDYWWALRGLEEVSSFIIIIIIIIIIEWVCNHCNATSPTMMFPQP